VPMSGPSERALAGHHLLEAIRHLSAAAQFIRELPDRSDADDIAKLIDSVQETVREVRDEVEEATR